MLSFRMRIAHKANWYGADSEERTTVESIKGADSTDSILYIRGDELTMIDQTLRRRAWTIDAPHAGCTRPLTARHRCLPRSDCDLTRGVVAGCSPSMAVTATTSRCMPGRPTELLLSIPSVRSNRAR